MNRNIETLVIDHDQRTVTRRVRQVAYLDDGDKPDDIVKAFTDSMSRVKDSATTGGDSRRLKVRKGSSSG